MLFVLAKFIFSQLEEGFQGVRGCEQKSLREIPFLDAIFFFIVTGCIFVKRHIHAFIAGFLGVATAWSILFVVLVAVAQAYVVGEVFAILIGAPGMGRFIVSLSILIGGFLGGSGALVGYSVKDLVIDYRNQSSMTKEI